MSKPLLSVVIPAFNEEKSLAACLSALTHQEHPGYDLEIIVVDNNCTDSTVKIAESFGAKVVKEKEQGNVFSLHKGLLSAGGEIIAATDADTTVGKGWMLAIIHAFQDPSVIGVTGPVKPKAEQPIRSEIFGSLYTLFLKTNFALGKPHFTGSNLAVRRDALHMIHGLDLRYRMSADVNLSLRLHKIGKVIFSPDMKVTASSRRWQKKPFVTLSEYTEGYINTVWRGKPSKFQQKSIT